MHWRRVVPVAPGYEKKVNELMRLDPHEAAKKLFKMRRQAERQTIREPVTGATRPPLPYKHPFIGARAEVALKDQESGLGRNTNRG